MSFILGRFDYLLYVPPSDETTRLIIIKSALRKLPVDADVDLKMIAKQLINYTRTDLQKICEHAKKLAITEYIKKKEQHQHQVPVITRVQFEHVIKGAAPSITNKDIKRYETCNGLQKLQDFVAQFH